MNEKTLQEIVLPSSGLPLVKSVNISKTPEQIGFDIVVNGLKNRPTVGDAITIGGIPCIITEISESESAVDITYSINATSRLVHDIETSAPSRTHIWISSPVNPEDYMVFNDEEDNEEERPVIHWKQTTSSYGAGGWRSDQIIDDLADICGINVTIIYTLPAFDVREFRFDSTMTLVNAIETLCSMYNPVILSDGVHVLQITMPGEDEADGIYSITSNKFIEQLDTRLVDKKNPYGRLIVNGFLSLDEEFVNSPFHSDRAIWDRNTPIHLEANHTIDSGMVVSTVKIKAPWKGEDAFVHNWTRTITELYYDKYDDKEYPVRVTTTVWSDKPIVGLSDTTGTIATSLFGQFMSNSGDERVGSVLDDAPDGYYSSIGPIFKEIVCYKYTGLGKPYSIEKTIYQLVKLKSADGIALSFMKIREEESLYSYRRITVPEDTWGTHKTIHYNKGWISEQHNIINGYVVGIKPLESGKLKSVEVVNKSVESYDYITAGLTTNMLHWVTIKDVTEKFVRCKHGFIKVVSGYDGIVQDFDIFETEFISHADMQIELDAMKDPARRKILDITINPFNNRIYTVDTDMLNMHDVRELVDAIRMRLDTTYEETVYKLREPTLALHYMGSSGGGGMQYNVDLSSSTSVNIITFRRYL